MPKVKVLKRVGFKYGGTHHDYGDTFDMKQKDARWFVAGKLVAEVPDAPDNKASTAKPAEPKAAPKKATAKAPAKATARKGKPVSAMSTYNRRDMKAGE